MEFSSSTRIRLILVISGISFTQIALCQGEQVECEVGFGKQPNPEDDACETFIECMDYVGSVKKCEGGQQFDFIELKCRKDEHVWCEDQLETLRAEANESSSEEEPTTLPPLTTTEAPTSTTEPATTTPPPEPTTAAATTPADQDGGLAGVANGGGRWGPLLRIIFPQFFNRQAGPAPGAVPRNAFAPGNAGVGGLPQVPVANPGLLGGGNLIPALGRDIINRRRIPFQGVNQIPNAGQTYAAANVRTPALPSDNIGSVGEGSNQISTSIGQTLPSTSTDQALARNSSSTIVSGDESLTVTVNDAVSKPPTNDSTPRQDINRNSVALDSRSGKVEPVENNDNVKPGLNLNKVPVGSDTGITLTSASASPNTTHAGTSDQNRGSLNNTGDVLVVSPIAPSAVFPAEDIKPGDINNRTLSPSVDGRQDLAGTPSRNTPLTRTSVSRNSENRRALFDLNPPSVGTNDFLNGLNTTQVANSILPPTNTTQFTTNEQPSQFSNDRSASGNSPLSRTNIKNTDQNTLHLLGYDRKLARSEDNHLPTFIAVGPDTTNINRSEITINSGSLISSDPGSGNGELANGNNPHPQGTEYTNTINTVNTDDTSINSSGSNDIEKLEATGTGNQHPLDRIPLLHHGIDFRAGRDIELEDVSAHGSS